MTTQGTYGGALITYSDSACSIQVGLYADIPPGTCSIASQSGPGSANVNCNGAFTVAVASVPLLAALSVLVSLLM